MVKLIEKLYLRTKINWGYIKNDSKKTREKYILIGIDYPGYNMPERLHFPEDILAK